MTRESIRIWCIKFSDVFAQGLRHREPRRGSRWHLDEMHVDVRGITHWLWRAIDEHGIVLDVVLQRHRDTEAARSFFVRLLGEHDIPETVHTDKLWSDGSALRELPVLYTVEHVQVVSTARCNYLVEQSHRPTRRQERQASDHDDAHRDFSICTPALRICTTRPAAPYQLITVATTNNRRSRYGAKWCGRRPELQAAGDAEALWVLRKQQLATTGCAARRAALTCRLGRRIRKFSPAS